jgi:hypothetical protein
LWVRRTEDEVARWHEITRRDARSNGLTIAILAWVAVIVLASFGVFYYRGGIVIQHHILLGSGLRLAIFLSITAAISYWIYRFETLRELAEAGRRTRCPACGAGSADNLGQSCGCGDVFVPQSTMKWVEDR